ncbi:MAG TPA: cytochrome b/b6 domain-containing protein, partial [Ignavibacteriaceae bacterium]|nr:cytochrome b/b6 domain-containing protein [Ignavibacteriaceae bacterium]
VSCKNCHGTHNVNPINRSGSKWSRQNIPDACGSCHKDEKSKYLVSDHGRRRRSGDENAPDCISCHQNVVTAVTVKKDTLELKIAQQQLCLSCHLDDPEIRARTAPSAGFIRAYEQSVHGVALQKGKANAATCIDCHNSHEIYGPVNTKSSVNKFNIPQTCGKCHSEIVKEYWSSVHGKSVLKGNKDAPVCTDCHGEHNILPHTNPNSPVAFQNLSRQVCSPCHSSLRLSEKYGIASDRYKTFSDSYHGLALRGGSVEVANCASCHGVHNIKASSDPTSSVNKKNLVKTCGSCHPGANENFTIGRIHVSLTKESEPILYWISTLYIIMIVSIIGGMLIHNILDFIKKAKIKKLRQSGMLRQEHTGRGLYIRMTLDERIQHIALTVSFITLVITGFMLRFPDSWWVAHIRDLSKDAFEYRSLLHRIAAVILICSSLYHLYYIFFTARGKQLLKDLLPVYEDFKEAIGVAKFNLGISKEKPRLGRFSYIEKAEYWALLWGTVVMSITGIIMWFDNTFIGLFTKLGWDIARTIHYFEAWLAFLAIIVWHFYFVIFNPDVYPMNTSWIDGMMSEEEMAEEHPRELEKIKEEHFKKENEAGESADEEEKNL